MPLIQMFAGEHRWIFTDLGDGSTRIVCGALRPGKRMHGSPTLLVDGTDPFAVPGQPPSLSCRLYRDAAGRMSGAPTVEALRRVLAG